MITCMHAFSLHQSWCQTNKNTLSNIVTLLFNFVYKFKWYSLELMTTEAATQPKQHPKNVNILKGVIPSNSLKNTAPSISSMQTPIAKLTYTQINTYKNIIDEITN